MINTYISKEYLLEKGYIRFNDRIYLFPENHHASITRLNSMTSMVEYMNNPDKPSFYLKTKISTREELEKVVALIDDIIYPLPF